MPLDINELTPFWSWAPLALISWLGVVAFVAVAVTAVGWLVAAVRHGPALASQKTALLIQDAVADLTQISPRRVWALARLAIQESIRRRVVVVFAVFIFLLLFAGWFLDPSSEDPARLYLSFVLTATSYLALLLALILSSLSLPTDIKNRTLHTVVTKPVRASEVVLGRIVGFVVVGTLLLALMGAISYLFVIRSLPHTHQIIVDNLRSAEAADSEAGGGLSGRTEPFPPRGDPASQHRHKVTVSADGRCQILPEKGHTHAPPAEKVVPRKKPYEVGPAEGMLLARVPIYGRLTFRGKSGQPAEKGDNVGNEWAYRSFIAGGTQAAAVWKFEGITEEAFPNGLPVELNIDIFRTHKGNIDKGVAGSLSVKNPKTGLKVEAVPAFEGKEHVIDVQFIRRALRSPDGKEYDLFKDIVSDGGVEIWLQCIEPQQYYGAGQADMYLRARDASFALNFAVGYLGIWLQMAVVIALGVTLSTFLSGPIAMLATLGVLMGGYANDQDFMSRLAAGQTYGGGPFESLYRMITQQSISGTLDPGLVATVVQILDGPARLFLWAAAHVVPKFGRFSFDEYVASGFSVSNNTVLTLVCQALAFILPLFVAGYLCLRTRELGQS